ncbi:MAG: MYXO-CTERM sorting domain-containing protein, partial [Myxococcales bacterium]
LGGLSASKLGPHVMSNPSDSSAVAVLNECPRLAKWISRAGEVAPAIGEYRVRCPGAAVVVRVDVQLAEPYHATASAEAAADDYWRRMLSGLAGLDAQWVDWLEGPNEEEAMPGWTRDPAKAAWYAEFWSRLADLMTQSGFAPLVGAIPMGEPALGNELEPRSPNLFKPIAEAMKAKPYRWGWSYHAYSRNLSRDFCAELDRTLRYRRIRDECGLEGVPIVLSEAAMAAPGWLASGTSNEAYMEWLRWLDARAREDSEVLGVALFQFGDKTTAKDFDLAKLEDELVAHLRSPPEPGERPDPDTCAPADPTDPTDPGDDGPSGGTGAGGGMRPGVWDEGNGCGCSSSGTSSLLLLASLLFPLARRRRISATRR